MRYVLVTAARNERALIGNTLRSAFHYGKKDYYLGGHPVWQVCRMAYRMPRPVSPERMESHRKEQVEKLRSLPGRTTAA